MRSFRRLVLGLVLLTLVTPLKAETVMYCSAEIAAGLIKDNGSWRTGFFKPDRYTIKFDKAFSTVQGVAPSDAMKCRPNGTHEHMIICSSEWNDGSIFGLNRNTGRFFYSDANIHGFISDLADPDTDALQAGTCTKF